MAKRVRSGVIPASELQNIQFIGLSRLGIDNKEMAKVKKIAQTHAQKLSNFVDEPFGMALHVKAHSREGKRHKFSVHLRLSYPGGYLASTRMQSWNCQTAIQEAFASLESELEHRGYRDKTGIRQTPSIRRLPLSGAA